jgi:hypothetical protein
MSIFACAPLVQSVLNGTCAIVKEGDVSNNRVDLELQTLRNLPRDLTEPIAQKLNLRPNYFQPRLFEPTFSVADPRTPGTFPKTVVVLSIGSNVVRTVYRHKESGLLVDPGGWWLNQAMENVLTDLTAVSWFNSNFATAGKLGLDAFVEGLTQIVKLLKAGVTEHVLVYNLLSVEPGNETHNYQFVRHPHTLRQREFGLAAVDLSRSLDFSIVDVDRILQRHGVQAQVDFAHAPAPILLLVAKEVFRILREREVF